eukprot:CAMPEP_0172937318 /NCGR_PEP_ID=MMETSP1075-20121228/222464_1 /TAXON_ID=2916 /ORGANISM="Ceratium fusus, Strain PA161109" /LENGTH=179 /DNA_ID=CAMNT_0013798693 /DNA_START=495 /DNA_END=1031 /DNA_ORIENTATION=+
MPPKLARYVDKDVMQASCTVGGWVLAILFLNHNVACGWYGLGAAFDTLPTWVEVCRQEYMSHTKGEPDRYYFYTTSLHWTLTMFTPASMEVVPENSFERIYCILTILSAIIFFSTLVSSITTAVATFRRKRAEQMKLNADLVGFLRENHISLKLGTMIQTCMQKHVTRPSQVHRIHESD